MKAAMPTEDSAGIQAIDLTSILNKSERKIAFEHLMALNLLTGQLDKIVAMIGQLDNFGYDEIPRHYEEAILIYQSLARTKVNPGNLRISSRTMERSKNFERAYANLRNDGEQAAINLAAEFGDTYFYYFAFDLPRFRSRTMR